MLHVPSTVWFPFSYAGYLLAFIAFLHVLHTRFLPLLLELFGAGFWLEDVYFMLPSSGGGRGQKLCSVSV